MQATQNRELLEVLLHEARKPAWPRLQVSVGRKLSRLFFKPTATSQSLACSALPG